MLLLENSIKSPHTRKTYLYHLKKFLEFYYIKDYDSLAGIEQEKMQIMVEDYVMHLKKEKSANSIIVVLAAIRAFLECNDIELRWKKIKRLMPAKTKKTGAFAWSTEEIQTMPKSQGGPYSKQELEKRRSEVYRLHFDYGYSARKIADMMKISRNTINSDVQYWYSKIKNNNTLDPQSTIMLSIERLDLQRTRLREDLDKITETLQKIPLERLIYEIDCKMAYIRQRLADSDTKTYDYAIAFLNAYLKSTNQESIPYILR